jgi:parallel beta-helix repeat protein
MQRWLVVLVAVVAMGCLTGSAFATTYYVATWGNDGWPGTETEPWATLQHAVETISPGDTILVRGGTYAGCRIEISGQAGAEKTLKNYPSETVVVNTPGAECRHNSLIEVENYAGTTRHWVIDGFELTNAGRSGADLRDTEYVTVRNCFVHDSGVTGIFTGFAYYPTFENNESCYNGEHGIYQSNSGDYPTVRGNTLHHNYSCGLHMNGDLSMGGDGTISYGTIEKNVIYENGTGGGSAINFDGGTDCTVTNNLVYRNYASGISLYAIDGAVGSSRNLVYNNTFVMPSNGRWAVNIPPSSGSTPDPVDNKVKNNILYNAHSFRGAISTYSSSVQGFESDYNAVVNRFSIDDGSSVITLSQWQGYGYDLHSFLSTPAELFVDPNNDDYHLKDGSPAINAGTTLAEVADDLDGVSRPQGSAYDIGCYEKVEGPVPPVADFEGNPTSGDAPLTVYFTDLSTGNPTSWDWTFGDSGTSQAQDPSHEYTTADTYTVGLTVANTVGQDTETKVDYITVTEGQPPVADFSGNPTSGNAPLMVYFTDESSGSPTSWDWSFGDSGTSQVQHPSHEYTAVDSYTVSLTAANEYGQDTETKPDYITVTELSCHVGAIDMAKARPPKYRADATITVHDQDCQPLAGVTVDITWSGAAPGSDSDVTDEYGQVTFTSGRNKAGGTYTCCVDNLTKEGYPYNSGANHETCDSITLP